MSKLLKNTKSTKSATQVLLAVAVLSVVATHVALGLDLADAFASIDIMFDRTHGDLAADPAFAD